MNRKDDLEAALRSSAKASAPAPDRSFVDSLEQRLLAAGDDHKVVPLARRARRIGVATTAAIAFTVAGVAAAAGIVVTHPFADDAPNQAPVTAPLTEVTAEPTEVATSTTDEVTSTTDVATTETTLAATTTLAPTTTMAPTTVPATVPLTVAPTTPPTAPPTAPPTTAAPVTTTTEVHVPATLSLTCTPNATTIVCSWSGTVPANGGTYAVLRGDLSNGGPGRVFTVPLGTTTWRDPMAVEGVTYSYVVHVFDVNGSSLGHSNGVVVGCC